MEKDKLLKEWLHEEEIAYIKGWDFSHIKGRYKEEDNLPWDFKKIIDKYLDVNDRLLDMETGRGEFLLTFNHKPGLTSATEGYEPNIKICKEKLVPLGINFKPAHGGEPLPFEGNFFDIITNRHGSYDVEEVKRILKKDALFLTQQVGSQNDIDLIELVMGNFESEFSDIAALVWFARVIDWEFPNFSVEKYKDNLFKAQEILEKEGKIEGRIHRYYFVAQKK